MIIVELFFDQMDTTHLDFFVMQMVELVVVLESNGGSCRKTDVLRKFKTKGVLLLYQVLMKAYVRVIYIVVVY